MTCFSAGTLEIYIEPQYFHPRLLIVGRLPVAQALAYLGKVMNYHVVAIDPDGHSIPHADLVTSQLDKAADYIRPDTYVIVATHGNYDEIALEKVLKAKPTYVGLVASSKRFQEVLNYLQLQGLTKEELQPLKAPAGLDIQARRSDEIALSIMTEIVQRRRNRHEILDLAAFQPQQQIIPLMEVHSHHQHEHHHHAETPTVAIDPVCGMEVEIATAQYMNEYNGEIYYFCARGCQTTFEKNPQAYIHAIET
jgi:xanthine dehydrogenase accessory factor